MQSICIYFNEQCTGHVTNEYHWGVGIEKMGLVIEAIFEKRSDLSIALPAGQWQTKCGELHLFERIKKAYPNREKYRRLLNRIRRLEETDSQLMQEIYWNGTSADGLNLADSVKSWALSIILDNEHWKQSNITADRCELDSNGDLTTPSPTSIRHLSDLAHIAYWEKEIRDWGATPAQSCILDRVNGHPIVMYQGPKEHNPPHVHRLDKQCRTSLAKYRIDIFERPKGLPNWDGEMKAWIEQYREQLLRSWLRCQQGSFPFALVK